MFVQVFIFVFILLWIWNETSKFSSKSSKKYIPKIPGLPYLGIGLEFIGRTREEIFKKLVNYCNNYHGRVRGNAGHHKWIGVAVPEDIELIVNDKRFFEKSDEYSMARDWLQDGLIAVGDKNKWQNRRKALVPAFHFRILEEFVEIFEHQADILVEILHNSYVGSGTFDICNLINLYTLDVICETSMGIKMNAQTQKESDYVDAIKEITRILVWRQAHFLARDDWFWNFTPQKRRYMELVKKINEFIVLVIDNRKIELSKIDRGVNNNQDEFGIKRRLAFLDILLESKINGEPLTTTDIQEEVNNFMFAGHDTTTSAIEFLLYNLAKHPEVQEKVYNEVIEVFGEKFSHSVTLSKLNNLHYLDLVIKESMRLYPPVPLIARNLREDVEINGYTFSANHNVVLFIYNLHRDERYHEQPLKFFPERFLKQTTHETMNAYSYIPFSAGLRNCIGQKFAIYEIKILISKIIHNFVVKLEDNFEVQYTWEIILRPVNGIRLELIKRQNNFNHSISQK